MTLRRQAIRYRPILREPPVIVVGEPMHWPVGAFLMIGVGASLLFGVVLGVLLRWGLG